MSCLSSAAECRLQQPVGGVWGGTGAACCMCCLLQQQQRSSSDAQRSQARLALCMPALWEVPGAAVAAAGAAPVVLVCPAVCGVWPGHGSLHGALCQALSPCSCERQGAVTAPRYHCRGWPGQPGLYITTLRGACVHGRCWPPGNRVAARGLITTPEARRDGTARRPIDVWGRCPGRCGVCVTNAAGRVLPADACAWACCMPPQGAGEVPGLCS